MLKRIAVLTSGGDSPGMNPAVRSIARTGTNLGLEVVGIINGYQGIFERQFMTLGPIEVSGTIRHAGTMLGTSRCAKFRDPSGPAEALQILRSEGIQALVVIGGDGSLSGARELHRLGFPVIGLPGTIDNDLFGTDMGLGVGTALNTIIQLVDMIKSTAASHRRCFVIEVMGRSSGYLALMATISTGSQVAVLPELRINMDDIMEALDRRVRRRHNNSVIIVAEGVSSGQLFIDRLKEAGVEKVNQELRLTVLGHVQRGGSPSHYDRLLGTRMGEFAILALQSGESGSMVGTVNAQMQLLDFDQILGKRKPLPSDALRLARNLGIVIGDPAEG